MPTVRNVIEPAQTRYIVQSGDLETFLKKKFGHSYDFNIKVRKFHAVYGTRLTKVAHSRSMDIRCTRDGLCSKWP